MYHLCRILDYVPYSVLQVVKGYGFVTAEMQAGA